MHKDEPRIDVDPPGPPLGAVVAGPYLLEIGNPAGTILDLGPAPDAVAAGDLARALAQPEPIPEAETTAVEAVDELVDEASAATAKVEKALALSKGVSEGRILDPAQLGLVADTLLDLLDRLDRKGRAKEALRLARVISKIYSLLRRWMELLRALRTALRCAEKLGDMDAIGWAKHELGTLQLAAGDVAGAHRTLSEAAKIRERLGNSRDLAVTERNLGRLLERLPPQGHLGHGGTDARPPTLRLLPAILVGAVLFGAGVAGGAVVGGSSDSNQTAAGAKTKTETKTVAQNGTTTETVVEPSTTTVTDTTTTTVIEKVGGSSETGE
jgi:tetratricopeptide (TPR) repeat protein